MNNISPRQISVIIASIPSIVLAILIYAIVGYHNSIVLMSTLVGMIFLFIVSFYISIYFLSHFITDRIKPIFKTFYQIDPSSKEFRKPFRKLDALKEIKTDIDNWNIEKLEEIDQLKQLEKYRREFIGNVSHELKTPIFNIQGYISTLLDGGLEDPSINRLYLERAEKSINRMISIVADLEIISRLETGELKLELEEFNIVNLVNDVFELQEFLANKYEVKLVFAKHYDKPIRVIADKQKIIMLANNLIVNSIKYGRKGGTTTVSFFDLGEKISIEVSDTGIGIAEKDQIRIFERFYRTDKSRSRDQGGSGLGLSIVKHIVEAHEQTINVRSKLGEGSSFSFTLNKAISKK